VLLVNHIQFPVRGGGGIYGPDFEKKGVTCRSIGDPDRTTVAALPQLSAVSRAPHPRLVNTPLGADRTTPLPACLVHTLLAYICI